MTYYQGSQNLKLAQLDPKNHNPQSIVRYGTQYTFCPGALTVTAWSPEMETEWSAVSDRPQAN